jgi:PTH1 family peptidyl-tRNA hydrolase
MIVKAVFGLGNPGKRYEQTRHNLGRMAIHHYLERWRERRQDMQRTGHGFSITYRAGDSLIVEPLTYMNLSGLAVKEIREAYSLALSDCLLVYDEYAIPFGQMKAKPGGGSGGHQGVASVIAELSTRAIPRLRLGIGRAEPIPDLVDFILQEFDEEEKRRLPEVLDRAAEAIACFLAEGLAAVMNRFNVSKADA